MADVVQSVGILEQIRQVAGLRWRILRNSLRKKNHRLDLIGLILAGILSGIFVLGLCFAFYAGAYTFLSNGRPGWMALPFWGVFLFWQIFPVFAAGFGVNFEFRSLLRFPLSLSTFYIIGLAYGLADFSAIASLCWLLAITLGAAMARPDVLPTLLAVVALFVLMNVTLERLVGSWLERLLARRRTRELFLAFFILSMVSLQFISPILNRYGNAARPWVDVLLPYFTLFPGSLAGRAVVGAALHHFGDVLLGVMGISLYVLLFSGMLWLRFAAQYRGEELSESAAPARIAAKPVSKGSEQSDALRVLSPQVAAVVRKEFRYLTRNSFSFLLLIMPPAFVLLFASQFAVKHPLVASRPVSPDLFFPGMMGYLILILMSPAYNGFAYEGRGIQTYFAAPVKFRNVFLGKNLMLIAVLALELTLSMTSFSYLVGLPSAPIFFATLAAIVFVAVGQLSIANWSSLSFPRKLEFGQMRGQRQSGMAVLVAFGAQILLGGISAPILFMGRRTGNPWLPAEAFTLLAVAAVGGYFASLDALTELAEKKKEVLIEALCR